jgi:hypothetical protein
LFAVGATPPPMMMPGMAPPIPPNMMGMRGTWHAWEARVALVVYVPAVQRREFVVMRISCMWKASQDMWGVIKKHVM